MTQDKDQHLQAHVDQDAVRRARSWKYLVRDAGLLLTAVGVVGLMAGPATATLVLFPAALVAEEVHGALTGRRERKLRRDPRGQHGLSSPPTLKEQLSGLLGKVGRTIAGRAKADLDAGAWGSKAMTVAYEVDPDGVRPVSSEYATKMRAEGQDFSQVSVTRHGATVLHYAGGVLTSRSIAPAVMRFNERNELVGAVWFDNGRPRRSVGLSGELRVGFNPDVLAARIAETSSRRGPDFPLTTEQREVNIDTVAWEASQLAMSLGRVSGPNAEPARRCAALLEDIASHARGLHATGTDKLRFDVGYPSLSERDLTNLRDQIRGAHRVSTDFRRYEEGRALR
ncbi:hypothetical protein [Azospirillum argentinense]|uniref:Uncharacterized protein n=1 Tax=Azospirillum argentinense TaxID=2970906 RepID=A0A5B0KQT1_9PROT|nr:hypothetical protein [Azospirillum argentinense]KAA1053134.1 hypothetical protein FH063_003053 [Azospirillum argentinense]